MQFKKYLGVILTSLLLVSCASTHTPPELKAGKASFEDGYYKEAFHQLLPIAVKGNAEAQYAIGYMYYYGYGVSEDTESGMFWITNSADQHYPPAVKALEVMHCPTPEYESIIPVRQPDYSAPRRDVVLRSAPREPTQSVHIVTPKKVSSTDNSHKYALQLYGSYHLNSVQDLQLQLRLKNTGHIYQTKNQGKDWYVLTFGSFASAHEASATQHNLPSELKQMRPWVRNVNELQLV